MKKLFVDTNILIDLVADRRPYSKFAIQLFQKSENQEVKLYTSSHTIATTHYILKKYLPEKELREVLFELLEFLTVVAVDVEILKKGLRSKHKDFEDSIQIFCASSVEGIDGIVTRNTKDYKDSEIPAFNPDELF